LATAFDEPPASIGRWIRPTPALRRQIWELAHKDRHRTFGYRRIWALLRKGKVIVNKKTVRRIMKDMGLSRPKFWHKRRRPNDQLSVE
jgi:hypothetical protein